MRILYFFPNQLTPMFNWQQTHFFNELSHYGVEIDSFNPLLCESWNEANDRIVKLAQNKKYDLFMADICSAEMLYIDTLKEIKKTGIPTLSFRPDNLVIPYNDKVLSPFFDLIWLTARETKWMYDKWEAHTIIAPYAANPFTFLFQNTQFKRNVCFIGTPYGSRSIMINSLTSRDVTVDLFYGSDLPVNRDEKECKLKLNIIQQTSLQNYIGRIQYKEGRKLLLGALVNRVIKSGSIKENRYLNHYPSIAPSEISKYYSEYSLSLASTSTNHTDALKNPLKIVNLRNFEIPMSGGLEICKYNPELAEYYEEDKEIVFYRTDEELVDKARFYTQRIKDDELYKLKEAARRKSESEHTWRHRFNAAFEKLGLKKV